VFGLIIFVLLPISRTLRIVMGQTGIAGQVFVVFVYVQGALGRLMSIILENSMWLVLSPRLRRQTWQPENFVANTLRIAIWIADVALQEE
jgi:hypothetical protein